jgi:hypothetical protein
MEMKTPISVLLLPGLAFAKDKRAKSTEDVIAERNGTVQEFSGLSAGTTKVAYEVTNVVLLVRPGTRPERFKLVCRCGYGHPFWRSCVELTAGQHYTVALDMDSFKAVITAHQPGENLTKSVTFHSRIVNVEYAGTAVTPLEAATQGEKQ